MMEESFKTVRAARDETNRPSFFMGSLKVSAAQ
jgi:hypothetical protein